MKDFPMHIITKPLLGLALCGSFLLIRIFTPGHPFWLKYQSFTVPFITITLFYVLWSLVEYRSNISRVYRTISYRIRKYQERRLTMQLSELTGEELLLACCLSYNETVNLPTDYQAVRTLRKIRLVKQSRVSGDSSVYATRFCRQWYLDIAHIVLLEKIKTRDELDDIQCPILERIVPHLKDTIMFNIDYARIVNEW